MHFPVHLINSIINQANLNFSYRDSKAFIFFSFFFFRAFAWYFVLFPSWSRFIILERQSSTTERYLGYFREGRKSNVIK